MPTLNEQQYEELVTRLTELESQAGQYTSAYSFGKSEAYQDALLILEGLTSSPTPDKLCEEDQ